MLISRELISRTVDLVRVDLMGVDLEEVDLVGVDLEALNHQYCAAGITISREEVTWLLEPRPSLSAAVANLLCRV